MRIIFTTAYIQYNLHNIYDLISIYLFAFHGYNTDSQFNQFPDGLIAQLVEHCTDIRRGHGFESRSRPELFSVFNFTATYVVYITG